MFAANKNKSYSKITLTQLHFAESHRDYKILVQAIRNLENKNFEGSITACNNLINKKEESNYLAAAYNCRGDAYKSKENFCQALLDYLKAVELEPQIPYFIKSMNGFFSEIGSEKMLEIIKKFDTKNQGFLLEDCLNDETVLAKQFYKQISKEVLAFSNETFINQTLTNVPTNETLTEKNTSLALRYKKHIQDVKDCLHALNAKENILKQENPTGIFSEIYSGFFSFFNFNTNLNANLNANPNVNLNANVNDTVSSCQKSQEPHELPEDMISYYSTL